MTSLRQRPATMSVAGLSRSLSGPSGRDGAHCVGLRALLTLGHLELDPLTLLEGLVAIHLDSAVVNEHVTTAVHGDEAVALLGVEPFDCALCHNDPACSILAPS